MFEAEESIADEEPIDEAAAVGAGINGLLCRRPLKPELDPATEDDAAYAATAEDCMAYEEAAIGVTDDAALA